MTTLKSDLSVRK